MFERKSKRKKGKVTYIGFLCSSSKMVEKEQRDGTDVGHKGTGGC